MWKVGTGMIVHSNKHTCQDKTNNRPWGAFRTERLRVFRVLQKSAAMTCMFCCVQNQCSHPFTCHHMTHVSCHRISEYSKPGLLEDISNFSSQIDTFCTNFHESKLVYAIIGRKKTRSREYRHRRNCWHDAVHHCGV
jgi:hypothetical protein